MYDFGERLKELRQRKKLSQRAAARKLNIDNSTLSSYERNIISPSIDILRSLAMIYNTTTDYILGVDHKQVICVDNLSERQLDVINTLLLEFKAMK
jgi:transcriptional regulator with XRE-family HTH domain